MKINYTQLFIKAHYFCYGALVGSIFPFLPVYGKQLGISPLIMGSIFSILPILYMITKPIVGFIMDYFHTKKKLIFITILVVLSSSYILIYFLPSVSLPKRMVPNHHLQNISCASLSFCNIDSNFSITSYDDKNTTCHWICKNTNFSGLSFHTVGREAIISSNTTCLLNINNEMPLCQEEIAENYNCNVTCNNFENNHYLYTSITFWGFVFLMSIGNIGMNICICITEAICFEILGKSEEIKYGRQRVWFGIGFGLAGFLTGYTVDKWSQGKVYKNYTPAFILVFVFTCIDLICCKKLKLPPILSSTNIFTDVCALLKSKSVVMFLGFAVIVGSLDAYLIFFLLWFQEDLAMKTGYMGEIKLIEGFTLAAQAFGSITIFMPLSGKILNKLGYGYTFTLSLVFYALRLGLISVVPIPWWIVLIEFLMMGPTYALSYTTTVTYANAISPLGISVSVQGIMSALREGFGFAIGNLMGGILLKKFGGALTLQIFSIFAAFSALMFFLLYITYLKHKVPDTRNNIEWRTPEDAREHCVAAE